MVQAKKILLSLGVILSFVAYSFHQRHEASSATSAVANNPNPTQPTTLKVSSSETEGGDDSTLSSTAPSSSQTGNSPTQQSGKYKNGSYVGNSADAYYGLIQVKVIISGGKLTDVQFLNHPSDNPTSQYINSQAMPMLKQEAISAQSANVNGVSGATDTSMAFVQSLQSALSKAM